MMTARTTQNCKINKYTKVVLEITYEGDKNLRNDYYMGQLSQDMNCIPKCPECNLDKVAGIFYGSTPSGGHDDKGNPVPSDKPFHPCREFAESLKEQNIVLQIDANLGYNELYPEATRPMWHCYNCGNNFDN